MRTMTERDYTLLLQLRDLAWALDDQIEAICDAAAALCGVSANDDMLIDLMRNRGDTDEFLKDTFLKVIKNGVEPKTI